MCPRPAPGVGASAAPVGLLNSQNGHMLFLPPYPRRPMTKIISANAHHPGGSHEPAHGRTLCPSSAVPQSLAACGHQTIHGLKTIVTWRLLLDEWLVLAAPFSQIDVVVEW